MQINPKLIDLVAQYPGDLDSFEETAICLFALEFLGKEGVNILMDKDLIHEGNEHVLRQVFMTPGKDPDSFNMKFPTVVSDEIDLAQRNTDFHQFKRQLAKKGMTSRGSTNNPGRYGVISYGENTRKAFESLQRAMGEDYNLATLINCIVHFYDNADFSCNLSRYLTEFAEADLLELLENEDD